MTPAESELRTKAARVMRAVRKRAGLTQIELALRLETSQSAVSKIEACTLAPPLLVWMTFCRALRVDPFETLETGYVDRPHLAFVHDCPGEGRFRLPERYIKDCGSTVRGNLPFLQFYEETKGRRELEQFLGSLKLDPDYFVILDQPLNLHFELDFIRHLLGQSALGPVEMNQIGSFAAKRDMHGLLHRVYDQARDQRELLFLLFSNIDQYDADFGYRIQSTDEGYEVSVSGQPHLRSFDYQNPELGSVICDYRKSFLRNFSRYRGDPSARVDEEECHFNGAERCLYRIRLATAA